MKAEGRVFKYGDNVDTDVIIPARYLNSSDPAELATHCMEDIDKEFVNKYRKVTSSLPIRTLVWFFQRTCTDCNQGSGRELCDRRNVRTYLLQKFYQYWSSDYRVPGSGKRNRCR